MREQAQAHRLSSISAIAAAALAALLGACRAGDERPEPPWTVVALSVELPAAAGDEAKVVRCDAEGDGCRPLGAGERFRAGGRLTVGKGSRASFELDGARLDVDGEAALRLEERGGRTVEVVSGTVALRREAAEKGGDSPTAIAPALRVAEHTVELAAAAPGTVTARADADGAMLTVLHGLVTLRPLAGPTQSLRSGDSVQLGKQGADRAAAWNGESAPVDGAGLITRAIAVTPRGLGTMTARVPGTEEVVEGVRLTSHRVHVVVRDGFSRTEIEEEFTNDTGRVLEGRYVFPLPAAASVSRLALQVGDHLVEGEMVERDRAARIFKGIVDDTVRPRDPALLEWRQGGEFSLKVFPIAPKDKRKVIVAYDEVLRERGGSLRYVYPLSAGADRAVTVEDFSIDVTVHDDVPAGDVRTPAYAANIAAGDGQSAGPVITFGQSRFTPSADFVVTYPRPDRKVARASTYVPRAGEFAPAAAKGASSASLAEPEGGFFSLRLAADLPEDAPAPALGRRDRAVVLDASASQSKETLAGEAAVASALVRRLDPDERFVLLACDSACQSFPEDGLAAVDEASLAAAARWLEGLSPSGSSDLAGSISHGAARLRTSPAAQLVVLGDGTPTSGELTVTSMAARLRPLVSAHIDVRLLGAGRTLDEVTLRGLARELSATYEPVNSGSSLVARVEEIAISLRSPVLRRVALELPPALRELQPAAPHPMRLGEELVVVGRITPGESLEGAAKLVGELDGKPYAREVPIRWAAAGPARANPLLSRVWAEARIAELQAAGAPVAEITTLSKRYHVMSRHTSLLVLESDRMFAEFGIGRTARSAAARSDHAFGALAAAEQAAPRARGAARTADEHGMIGVLRGDAGQAPSAPWAGLAESPQSARGNMWGSEPGDSFGSGGLGLSGIGEGGGGRGEGIGLGSVGTIGKGAGAGKGAGQGAPSGAGSTGFGRLRPRAAPPSGRVQAGSSAVSGRIPPEVIQRVVRQQFARLRACYERGLAESPTLAGRVAVRFVIGRDGSVQSAANGGSDLDNSAVIDCVVQAFRTMRFPAPESGIVTVTYPIRFTPSDPPPPAASGGPPVASRVAPPSPAASSGRPVASQAAPPPPASSTAAPPAWLAPAAAAPPRKPSALAVASPPKPAGPAATHRAGDERWRGEGEAVLGKLRAELAASPRARQKHRVLVRGLLARGRFDEALESARRFVEIDPDLADARELLSHAAAAKGDAVLALAALDAQTEAEPRGLSTHLRAARAFEAAGDERRACAHRRAVADLAGGAEALGEALRCRARVDGDPRALVEEGKALLASLQAAGDGPDRRGASRGELDRIQEIVARLEAGMTPDPRVESTVASAGQLQAKVECPSSEGCPAVLVLTPKGAVVSAFTPVGERAQRGAIDLPRLSSGTYRVLLVGGAPDARGEVELRALGSVKKIPFSRGGEVQTVAATEVLRI